MLPIFCNDFNFSCHSGSHWSQLWSYFVLELCFQVEKIEESIDYVNSKTKPLAAYLFTKNKKLQQDFVANVPAGGMLVNDVALHVRN